MQTYRKGEMNPIMNPKKRNSESSFGNNIGWSITSRVSDNVKPTTTNWKTIYLRRSKRTEGKQNQGNQKKLLSIAIEEKKRNLQYLKTQFITEKEKMKSSINPSKQQILKRLESNSAETANHLNKGANKKISFHLHQPSNINFAKRKSMTHRKRKIPEHRKRKNRQNH